MSDRAQSPPPENLHHGIDQSDSEDEAIHRPPLEFECRMESAKELHSLLLCLSNFKGQKKDQNAHVEVEPTQIVFMVKVLTLFKVPDFLS